ncbi:putative cyclic nucleotide-gated ion channel 8 [Phragmites australis]|uniref:putative cyclic nucleotide-gated ion channel 8 n=1 Tax=Phragmites australis TaxID=29695 RepID=UPI002D79CBDE|nr:putative cyclic nucleotide-gated ion channel 8 [Phragmites australis]
MPFTSVALSSPPTTSSSLSPLSSPTGLLPTGLAIQSKESTGLEAICERLKLSLCMEFTYIVCEGDPIDEMLHIIQNRLESSVIDDGCMGFYNQGLLKEGDFCNEELLTWALDPKAGANFLLSTHTIKAIYEVEAFTLCAEELKFITDQFRRLHNTTALADGGGLPSSCDCFS